MWSFFHFSLSSTLAYPDWTIVKAVDVNICLWELLSEPDKAFGIDQDQYATKM